MVHFDLEVVEAQPTALMHHFCIIAGSYGDNYVDHTIFSFNVGLARTGVHEKYLGTLC